MRRIDLKHAHGTVYRYRKDGCRCAYCRAARARETKAYRDVHGDELRQKKREYYASHREEKLARDKAYRERNRDKRCAQKREHYAANRDAILTHLRDHRAANRDAFNRSRREARAANPAKVMYREWRETHPCLVCGEREWRVIVAHHIDPSEKGARLAGLFDVAVMADELAKCAPLCFNHHELVHDAIRNVLPGADIATVVDHLRQQREATQ